MNTKETIKHTNTFKNYPMSVCVFSTCDSKVGQILVVRRKIDRAKLCLAGGKIREEENIIEAAQRESLEETGLSLNPVEIYPIYAGLCADDSGEKFYWNICFYKKVSESELNVQALEPELDNHWCTVEEFLIKNAFKDFNLKVIQSARHLGIIE